MSLLHAPEFEGRTYIEALSDSVRVDIHFWQDKNGEWWARSRAGLPLSERTFWFGKEIDEPSGVIARILGAFLDGVRLREERLQKRIMKECAS